MTNPVCSLSLDLDNEWSYLKTHGDPVWESLPSYLDTVVPRVLEILERWEWTITFFVVGQDAALGRNREALGSIAAAGHDVGNHSFHHEPWLHLYSEDQARDEIRQAEEAIEAATDLKPRGFRGPGYSLSPSILQTLAKTGYDYDASILATYLGPLARAYYFRASDFTEEEKEQRNALFGGLRNGLRPVKPFFWKLPEKGLLEIPVTTMPVIKLPFHFSYLLYINGLGFRGQEKAMEKPCGVCRVVFLGDSFTLGVGVKDEDTLPANFERAAQKTHTKVEALNFGQSSTSTDEQIELLRDYALSFDPDVVVVVMFLNDANRRWTIGFLSRPKILARVRKFSFFINATFRAVERPLLQEAMVRHYRNGYEDDNDGWNSIETALEAGKILSEEHDFRLVVALYPVLIDLDERRYPFKKIHAKIGRACKSMGIPFVDLFDSLCDETDYEMWVHATDQHPNEVAHAIAGEQLANFLLDQQGICGNGQTPVVQ